MHHRRRRAGRPRKDGARRRATTAAGRRPETDLGSPELLYRKARVANGGPAPVELTDVAGILAAHGLIEERELTTLRQLAGWLHQLATAYGLKDAGVGGLWGALLSGQRGGRSLMAPDTGRTGGDRAAFRLGHLYAYFARLHQLDRLALVMRVAAAEVPPETVAELAELRAGLGIVADMQRHGHRAPLAAE